LTSISPRDFAAKWRVTRGKERSTAQEHFIDVCRLLGVPTPNEADPIGDRYAFDAYGWPRDLSDEDILGRWLALNQERAGPGMQPHSSDGNTQGRKPHGNT
jgi:hypothetical protein